MNEPHTIDEALKPLSALKGQINIQVNKVINIINKRKYHITFTVVIITALIFMVILWVTIQSHNTGFEEKNLWDWMDLLLVPLLLGTGIWWLDKSSKQNEQAITAKRASNEDLQNFLKNMISLNTNDQHQFGNNNRNIIARTLTLTILNDLGPSYKAQVLQFIYESGQINKENPIIKLQGANFSQVEFPQAELTQCCLRETNFRLANLEKAKLPEVIGTKLNYKK